MGNKIITLDGGSDDNKVWEPNDNLKIYSQDNFGTLSERLQTSNNRLNNNIENKSLHDELELKL